MTTSNDLPTDASSAPATVTAGPDWVHPGPSRSPTDPTIASAAPPPNQSDTGAPPHATRATRVAIGGILIDNVSMEEAIVRIEQLIAIGEPSYVVTPNVDHIVKLQRDEAFAETYRNAALVLADGMPLLWAARLLGTPLREKVSGSDLFPAFCQVAADKGYRLFFLGGQPGAADAAAATLARQYPGLKVETYCPPYGFEKDPNANAEVLRRVREAKPDVLFIGLGAPKQELWAHRHASELGVPVSIGVGASFDFVAGHVRRAPVLFQRAGLEWAWRLAMEPHRLARRYLLEDPEFVRIIWRQRRSMRLAQDTWLRNHGTAIPADLAAQPPKAQVTTAAPPIPVFVDLDGTLVATDTLWETLLLLIKHQPLSVFAAPLWLSRGKAHLKQQIASRTTLNAAALPYRPEVLAFLDAQRRAGRPLVLATAADQRIANAVADHLGIFDDVIASNGTENTAGRTKLDAIRRRSGNDRFAYVGDSSADVPVWEAAAESYVAGHGRKAVSLAARLPRAHHLPGHPKSAATSLLRALRPHQWAKNLLIFVPLLCAHEIFNIRRLTAAALCFLAYGLFASAGYLVNDLMDLEADRLHGSKRRRPLASGAIPIPVGITSVITLLGAGLAIALAGLPLATTGMLVLYLALTLTYTGLLKRKLMVDVICLAGLYTHRVLTGGNATDIVVSPWLLGFSMFMFLSLAFAKRYTELAAMPEDADSKARGRGYYRDDLEMVRSMGSSSAYLAVLVMCFFISSPEIVRLYPHPQILWMMCPVLLYWVSRIWFLAQRRQLSDDPVIFAVKDRTSIACGLLMLLVVSLASFHR